MLATLKRSLSLPLLVLYGLGTTIGAGIYALLGELAGVSGYMAPASFLVASFMAALTAASFAELSGRFPHCAGAALYVKEGLNSERLSILVGLLVVAAGLVSAAALTIAFAGYLHDLFELNKLTTIIAVSLLLGGTAAWGITQSVFIAALVTVIEIGGLLLVIAVSHSSFNELPSRIGELIPSLESASLGAVYSGALLAFYAFIGFEDMVDVAEEVKEVKRNLPTAILLTLGITTLLYMVIMVAAVLSIHPSQLAASEAPLAYLYEHYTGDKGIIGVIGLFAIINGALIQMIMASRVLYGLSSRNLLPALLSKIHPRTRTPLVATFLVTVVVLMLAVTGKLTTLAELTSLIILVVFALVNLSLLRIKRRTPVPSDSISFPIWVPALGFLVCSGFVLSQLVALF
ncbi:MAG: amino acid permease [Gammaproteobacteria bacterium]|nr:MAG: amino acid permease [Gammaproteobacteria bacterium]